jgi:hypothetical protein
MEVTKDESYLDEVTFLNNKFVEVESKWTKSKFLLSADYTYKLTNWNKDRIWCTDMLLTEAKRVEEIWDNSVKIDWKKFKKGILRI